MKKTPDISLMCSFPAGWEWEDDFQALENTPYFQTVMDPHSVSLPSLDWTSPSRPKNRSVSHTCLVLTYVTESDLELWGKRWVTHTHTRACGIFCDRAVVKATSLSWRLPPAKGHLTVTMASCDIHACFSFRQPALISWKNWLIVQIFTSSSAPSLFMSQGF